MKAFFFPFSFFTSNSQLLLFFMPLYLSFFLFFGSTSLFKRDYIKKKDSVAMDSNKGEYNEGNEEGEEEGKMTMLMGVESEDITKLGVFKQLYKVGAFPVMLVLLMDWIAKSSARKDKDYKKSKKNFLLNSLKCTFFTSSSGSATRFIADLQQ